MFYYLCCYCVYLCGKFHEKRICMELTLTDRLYFSAQEKCNPEYIRNERSRIARERYYFANLRSGIYKRSIPSYIILKEGSLQAVYPEMVVNAIREIDEMERLHFLDDKFAMYVEERERESQYKESFT